MLLGHGGHAIPQLEPLLIFISIERVWKQNEEISVKLAAEMKPVEDVWEGRTWFSAWNHFVPVMIPGNPNRNY